MDFTGRVVVEQRLHRARRLAQPVGALHVAQRDRLAYLVSQPAGELAAVLVCLPEEPREVLCSGVSFPCACRASDSRHVITRTSSPEQWEARRAQEGRRGRAGRAARARICAEAAAERR